MKKMETSEEVDEYESCRSSDNSDLDELEANLYSYVHHERNSCFDEEYSTVFEVSSFEGVCQQKGILGENENVGQNSSSFTNGGLESLRAKENCSKSSDVNRRGKLVDSAPFVTSNESDSSCYVQSSSNVVPAQMPGKNAKVISGICVQYPDRSPSVLEVSSSDDLGPPESSLSKYRMPAASTPFKEYVVIDDSDEEVQIELERVKIKQKKKKRKKSEIKADIRLNTQSTAEFICLDLDEDITFLEKENVDSLLFSHDYENSEHEKTLCNSWTPQMAQFYDESWGGEFINVSELQRTMSDDGWKVDVSDEFSYLTSKFQTRRYYGTKSKAWCTKCNQKGHYRNECTEKISPPRCHRCGSSRHQEYSCNQKICLTCGRNRPSLVAACQQCRQRSCKKCYICQQPGHPPGCCPDLWRRFHATVVPGEIVAPQKVLYKDPKNTYCCNCASRGHHVFQCKKDNFSDYAPMNPKVASYVDPEVLLKFQNTCSRTSANWNSVGAIAPEYQNEDREAYSYLNRRIKRCKSSEKQRKSKIRKLSENTAPKPVNTEIVSRKQGKKTTKSVKKSNIKNSAKHKIKKGLRQEKGFHKLEKCKRGNENRQNTNSKLAQDINSKDMATTKGLPTDAGVKEKGTDIDLKTGFVERVVVLSPGHLKRIESEEGKEILKYVTDQFKEVKASVVSDSSVLSLMGAGNNIDRVKANLFDILNNKWGLDQLKKSVNTAGNESRVKKPNKIKKKFRNRAHQNNQLEMTSKDKTTYEMSNSGDLQISNNKTKIKKKPNAGHRLKPTLKNGKGSKFKYQGKNCSRKRALADEGGDHTKIKQSFDPVLKQSTNTRPAVSSEVSKSNNKDDLCETVHKINQVNEEVTHTEFARSASLLGQPSKVQCNVSENNCTKRNKNKGNGYRAKDKLRVMKLDGKGGIHPVSNQAKKLQKKMVNGLDKLGLITVDRGHNRKVSFPDEHIKYDHSRISKNQQCSQNSLKTKHLTVEDSSSKELRPQKFHCARTF